MSPAPTSGTESIAASTPSSLPNRADVVVIGAGIVGLASAHQILERHPELAVMILDKEPTLARHQTGHNSGVIHSGIYYQPDSHKAKMVADGRRMLLDLLQRHNIAHDMCAKVVVALDESEIPRLDALETRAADNHITTERLDGVGLREIEPHIAGVAALRVPSAGITDYRLVCEALVAEISAHGAEIRLGVSVEGSSLDGPGLVIHTSAGDITTSTVVNCGGLHSDRVARSANADTKGVRIMPFRGEYFELVADARHLVNNLVYPLPDPAFPFLGVHLTRMIDGSIHAGPNAVPALEREGYRWRDISVRDTSEIVFATRSWKLARRYWRTGLGEIKRSLSRRAFLSALQRLCPELTDADIEASDAGVRAQAIDKSGQLLDDFAFADAPRAIHVINAPSPAATASLAIGQAVAERHEMLMGTTS